MTITFCNLLNMITKVFLCRFFSRINRANLVGGSNCKFTLHRTSFSNKTCVGITKFSQMLCYIVVEN